MFSDRVLYEPGKYYEYSFSLTMQETTSGKYFQHAPEGNNTSEQSQDLGTLRGTLRRSVVQSKDGRILLENTIHAELAGSGGKPKPQDETILVDQTYLTTSDAAGRDEASLVYASSDSEVQVLTKQVLALMRTPLPAAAALQWQFEMDDLQGRISWRGEIDLPCSFLTLHDACLRFAPKKFLMEKTAQTEKLDFKIKGETTARLDTWHRHPVRMSSRLIVETWIEQQKAVTLNLRLEAELTRSGDLAAPDVQRILASHP